MRRVPESEIVECCDEARICALCNTSGCYVHSEPYPVNCTVNGFTCAECHEMCISTECAVTNADPDDL